MVFYLFYMHLRVLIIPPVWTQHSRRWLWGRFVNVDHSSCISFIVTLKSTSEDRHYPLRRLHLFPHGNVTSQRMERFPQIAGGTATSWKPHGGAWLTSRKKKNQIGLQDGALWTLAQRPLELLCSLWISTSYIGPPESFGDVKCSVVSGYDNAMLLNFTWMYMFCNMPAETKLTG